MRRRLTSPGPISDLMPAVRAPDNGMRKFVLRLELLDFVHIDLLQRRCGVFLFGWIDGIVFVIIIVVVVVVVVAAALFVVIIFVRGASRFAFLSIYIARRGRRSGWCGGNDRRCQRLRVLDHVVHPFRREHKDAVAGRLVRKRRVDLAPEILALLVSDHRLLRKDRLLAGCASEHSFQTCIFLRVVHKFVEKYLRSFCICLFV